MNDHLNVKIPSIKLIASCSGNETFCHTEGWFGHTLSYMQSLCEEQNGGGGLLLFGIIHSCVSSVSNYFGGLTHCSTELIFLLVLPLTQLLVSCLRDLFEDGYNL